MSEEVSEEKAVRKGLSKIEFLLLFLPVLAFAVFSLASPIFLIPLFFFSFLLVLAVWLSAKDELNKMLRKNVTIALGITCIILVAGLGGAMVYYTLVTRDKDSTISSKNSQISSLQFQNLQFQAWLDENKTYFQNLIAEYNWVLQSGFTNSTILIDSWNVSQGPNSFYYFASEKVSYAGYILVNVQSTTNNTYVQENYYTSHGDRAYEHQVEVGTNGTVLFPVQPTTPNYVNIIVGNTDPSGANITSTVTYYH